CMLHSLCSSSLLFALFFLLIRPRPRSTLFPYTTLFRSMGIATYAQITMATAHIGSHRNTHTLVVPIRKLASYRVDGAAHLVAKQSEEHTSELQSRENLVCRLLLEKKKQTTIRKRK